jgi:serine/threonine protein phosphatase PrpC
VFGFDNIEHASLSDVGVRRSHNQDSHAALLASDVDKWLAQGHLFLVADGMGAHAVGEKASELAASIIPHTYHKHAQQGPVPALRKAFSEANASIHSRGQANREFEGMGTTGTALVLRSEGAWLGHVGDSRAYRIRNGQIEQLTFDHSLVWVYARQQRIDPATVQNIPSNVIVRSLGPEPLVQVDIEGPHPVEDGDIYVLCSDGLSGPVSDPEIGAVASTLPPAEACRFLIDLANLRGGPDNITVVIVRVGTAGAGDGANVAPRRRGKSLFQMIPWPICALFLGIVLAGGAAALIGPVPWLATLLFLLATAAIIAGGIGLVLFYKQQKAKVEEEEEDDADRPPPRVYRQVSCRIDRPLVEKLVRANEALRQRAKERQWQPDWNGYQQHQDLAKQHFDEGDLVAAFREHCRALQPLIEVMLSNRGKDDPGPPVWERDGG